MAQFLQNDQIFLTPFLQHEIMKEQKLVLPLQREQSDFLGKKSGKTKHKMFTTIFIMHHNYTHKWTLNELKK